MSNQLDEDAQLLKQKIRNLVSEKKDESRRGIKSGPARQRTMMVARLMPDIYKALEYMTIGEVLVWLEDQGYSVSAPTFRKLYLSYLAQSKNPDVLTPKDKKIGKVSAGVEKIFIEQSSKKPIVSEKSGGFKSSLGKSILSSFDQNK